MFYIITKQIVHGGDKAGVARALAIIAKVSFPLLGIALLPRALNGEADRPLHAGGGDAVFLGDGGIQHTGDAEQQGFVLEDHVQAADDVAVAGVVGQKA